MQDNQSFDDREWTDEERAQLAALSTERIPRAELQERTTQALREAGLLQPHRRTTPRMVLSLAAAATIVFGVGAAVGYGAGARSASARREFAPPPTRSVAQLDTAVRSSTTGSPPSPPTASSSSPSSPAATRAAKQVVWF